MRAPLAYHHELTLAVHAVAMRAIEGWYRAQGRALGIDDEHTGSITVVQRFGSDLALNVHLHILSLDGVYDSTSHFTAITAPSLEQMEKLCTTIAARVQRLLLRRAIDHDEPEERALALSLSGSAARLGTEKYAPEGADIEHDHDASWKRKARVDGFDLEASTEVRGRGRRCRRHTDATRAATGRRAPCVAVNRSFPERLPHTRPRDTPRALPLAPRRADHVHSTLAVKGLQPLRTALTSASIDFFASP